jgi:hypothetical protein
MKHRFVWVSALSLLACGGSTLDVGANKGGSSSSTEGGSESGGNGSSLGGDESSGGSGTKPTGGIIGKGGAGGTTARGGALGVAGEQPMGARSSTGGNTRDPLGGKTGLGGAVATAGTPVGGAGTAAGAGGKPTGEEPPPDLLVPQVCGEKFSQVWEGNTLDFFFNPQNDKWRIEFDGKDASGRLCGTATYIAAGQEAPPPATDPDAGYPPSLDPMKMGVGRGPVPGVTYSIIQGAEMGGVVHFRISASELWKDWCALQVPAAKSNGYGCIGGDGWSSDGVNCWTENADGTRQTYAYDKCVLCTPPSVCTCNAKSCAAADTSDTVVFDLKHDGARLSGTVGSAMITLDLVE